MRHLEHPQRLRMVVKLSVERKRSGRKLKTSEVEVLGTNTLQDVIETLPPCLTDRIVELLPRLAPPGSVASQGRDESQQQQRVGDGAGSGGVNSGDDYSHTRCRNGHRSEGLHGGRGGGG
ncbi:unnamed protein product, partial [Choristocarpus tenellus]